MFQHLSIDAFAIQLDPRVSRLKAGDPLCAITDGVKRVVSTAFNIYLGIFRIERPDYLDGGRKKEDRLAWYDEYLEDIDYPLDVGSTDEMDRYISAVSRWLEDEGQHHRPAVGPAIYRCRELLGDFRTVIQGLAVEVLICADRYVAAILAGNLPLAAEWMQAMYERLAELTERILDDRFAEMEHAHASHIDRISRRHGPRR